MIFNGAEEKEKRYKTHDRIKVCLSISYIQKRPKLKF